MVSGCHAVLNWGDARGVFLLLWAVCCLVLEATLLRKVYCHYNIGLGEPR